MPATPTVMHVDDDAELREITRLSLELVGNFNLVQFESGTSAIEAAPGHSPDLILLDVMMPGLDGVETLKALRKLDAYRDKPCVFLTAKATQADNAALMEAGAAEVIHKPFDPMTLPDQLREILSR